MKSAIETFMGIIIVMIMVITATCYITASLDTRLAQNYHAAVISEIEASNHSESVITACEEKAKENGFEALEITPSGTGVSEVKLAYHYTLPFLNVFLEHEITGYAR